MSTPDPGIPSSISTVPTTPLPLVTQPTGKLRPGWSIQIFPYKRQGCAIVSWNAIIRHEAPGDGRAEIKVMAALDSPELAQTNAENFLRARGLLD